MLFSHLPFAAAVLSLLLALVSVVRKKPTPAAWLFFAGMTVLGIDSIFIWLSLQAGEGAGVLRWVTACLLTKAFIPAAWLTFSVVWSRGNFRRSLTRWRTVLVLAGLAPITLAVAFRAQLFEVLPSETADSLLLLRVATVGKALNVILLTTLVLILMNLEQTFRSAIGTMRWRIKFVVLGLAVIFGAHVYARTQAILFSTFAAGLPWVESTALLVGCLLLALAYARTGFAEIDVYPSRAVLRSSLTVLIVGLYLFVVGVLAQAARRFGGATSFQFQALVVLVGFAGLAALLLSDRLRQRVHDFVARHFRKAQHDSVRIWRQVSESLANVRDREGLCAASARTISETFKVLSVRVWVPEEQSEGAVLAASTILHPGSRETGRDEGPDWGQLAEALGNAAPLLDLEDLDAPWAEQMRRLNPSQFPDGGRRWCMPLRSDGQCLGAIVLADRVNGARYTIEETELLKCIGDQVASVLVNVRLANELARGRELEAFRTMSAFFVHDLKNAAASLNLMLKNMPQHFDDPVFREDALRGMGNTARRIEETIARLSALRQKPELKVVRADLNAIVADAAAGLDGTGDVVLTKDLRPVPCIVADSEQLRSVVANLLLNAREALGPGGRISVSSDHIAGRVVLSVRDDGCGMSPEFVRDSLFKPFHSTKKRGLGIGMFQARTIVEAHGGAIQVESEPGKGTTVRVSLPARDAS